MASNSELPATIETLILGAGLTGLSVAYHLERESLVVEAEDHPGGTASSLSYHGFHLDHAVHILYFSAPWTLRFITEELGVPLRQSKRKSEVWFCGKLVPFPLQFNLAALPIRERCRFGWSSLTSSLWQRGKVERDDPNFKMWARRHYGSKLTNEFFKPYNEKLWGIPPEELTLDWMDGYVPGPSAKSILRGLAAPQSRTFGANDTFWYPTRGGISAIADELARRVVNVQYRRRFRSINLRGNTACFDDGSTVKYGQIISTIPLKDLVSCIADHAGTELPTKSELRSNPLTIAHLLIPREGVGNGQHWIYVPQPEIPFYRVTLPHNIDPSTCPNGWSALTLEIGGKNINRQKTETLSKEALVRMGLLLPHEFDAEVLWEELDHGYVSYDRDREQASFQIRGYLREHGIISLGRYGRWEYSNMESALIQGREIRKRLDRGCSARTVGAPAIPYPRTAVQSYFENCYPESSGRLTEHLFKRGEADRLKCLRRWISHTEALSILDAGCGDGRFLSKILHGTPTKIKLEDFVGKQLALAHERLAYRADVVEAEICDANCSTDPSRYDLVLALGISDYERDWKELLTRLAVRCQGELIADFPKSGTMHSLVRRFWLRSHNISLACGSKSEIENLVIRCNLRAEIVELPLQWMVRIEANHDKNREKEHR